VTGKSLFNIQTAEALSQSSKQALIDLVLKQSSEGRKLIDNLENLHGKLDQKDKVYTDLKGLYEELQKKYLILEGQHVVLKSKFFGKGKSKGPVAARDQKKKKGHRGLALPNVCCHRLRV
jgi:hypothetical protein